MVQLYKRINVNWDKKIVGRELINLQSIFMEYKDFHRNEKFLKNLFCQQFDVFNLTDLDYVKNFNQDFLKFLPVKV